MGDKFAPAFFRRQQTVAGRVQAEQRRVELGAIHQHVLHRRLFGAGREWLLDVELQDACQVAHRFASEAVHELRRAAQARVDARFAAVDARIAQLEARLTARIDSLEARMDLKMERWAVRMVIAMVLTQTALGPIGMGALDAVRRALSTLVH